MLAKIEKAETGYVVQFQCSLNASIEEVWSALTENDRLEKWMSNLQIVDLRKGGTIKFNMNDGTGESFDINIIDSHQSSVLEFEWGRDRVRFELSPQSSGCLLVLKEFIQELNDHTPKDLAGWHVCLDMMKELLNGNKMDFPKDEWEKWYEQYKIEVNQIK
ncbi:SRPBCC family protein [Heyndrickxia sporothermodurans]